MSMKPYYEITNDEEDAGIYRLRFDLFDRDVVATEYYCVNPACDCEDILIDFHAIGRDEEASDKLMHLRLDSRNWRLDEVIYESDEAQKAGLADEFIAYLNDLMKSQIREHTRNAKAYAATVRKPFDADFIRSGTTIGYTEIFGEESDERFRIYEGVYHVLVDDAYCMNPKCECGKATLSFMDISPLAVSDRLLFAIHYHFKNRKYEVEYQQCGSETLNTISAAFLNQAGMPALLKSRYEEMKKEGRSIIADEHRMNQTAMSMRKEITADRNDPCPCGSFKKYKKCCGSGVE